MKIYIYKELYHVSDRYHEHGGLIVIAKDRKAHDSLVAKDVSIVIDKRPDIILNVSGKIEEQVIVFPNAGCC